jgi:hypothetical protein
MSPGVMLFISELMAKRLELFNGAMPSTPAIATLANPKNPNAESEAKAQKTSPQQIFCGLPQFAEILRDTAGIEPVPVGNLRPEILVMRSAQNWHHQRAADSLGGARDRRVLMQR